MRKMIILGRQQCAAACLLLSGLLLARPCSANGPPPIITAQPSSQTVPYLGTAIFSVTASSGTTLSYDWYKNGAKIKHASSSSYTIAYAQMTDQGSYSVKVINGSGSVVSSNATLTVDVPPTITTQPQSQTVVQSQGASFSVEASGTAPVSYQWNFNGTAMFDATNALLSLTNVQATQAGNYTVVVTNSWGAATSTVAALTVYVPPGIQTQPMSLAVTQGDNASFSVVPSGTSPFTYQWYDNGISLGRWGQSSTLTLDYIQSWYAGSYTVVVANTAGSITSAVATLTIDVPPGIQTQPQNLTVTQGQSASFSVVASGSAPFSYQWNFDGTALSDATNASLTLTNLQSIQAGSYTVVVTNPVGSVTSQVATLTVHIPPAITTQPQSQAVIQGQNVSFSVVASGTTNLSYQWYLNGSSLGGGGAEISTLTLNTIGTNNAGNYTVVVNNNWGFVTSVVATLTVLVPAGIQTQPQNVTVTQGQNASLSVVASGSAPFSYQWSLDGTALSEATNASLTLTNLQGIQAGSYTVVVTNPVGSVTSQVATLTVNIPPRITTQPQSQAVIQGQNVSFSVVASGTTNLSYQWYLNGSSLGGGGAESSTLTLNTIGTNNGGNYTVTVNNNWGSTTSSVATLTVLVPASIATQPQSQAITQSQNASLSVVASGTAPFSYQWNFDGTALSDATNASVMLTNVQTIQAGSYTVVVTNIAGSITSTVATLTVTTPSITLSLSGGGGRTSNGFTLQLSLPVEVTYVILASSDLEAWTPIATNIAAAGSVVFTDIAITNYPCRFYRAMVP